MISKKGSTTVGATKGYGLPKGFGSNHKTTFGYVQSKLIRTPLPLYKGWNAVINRCKNKEELIAFVSDNGTVIDIIKLFKVLGKIR